MASNRSRQAAMPFIMITVLLDMMSIGIIAPVLPKLIGTFMASGASTSVAYGLAQAAFAVAQFFSAPVLGALSDRYGRRPVLLLGLFGMAINFFVTALATEFWMLLAVRIMGGAVCANIAVANAFISAWQLAATNVVQLKFQWSIQWSAVLVGGVSFTPAFVSPALGRLTRSKPNSRSSSKNESLFILYFHFLTYP